MFKKRKSEKDYPKLNIENLNVDFYKEEPNQAEKLLELQSANKKRS